MLRWSTLDDLLLNMTFRWPNVLSWMSWCLPANHIRVGFLSATLPTVPNGDSLEISHNCPENITIWFYKVILCLKNHNISFCTSIRTILFKTCNFWVSIISKENIKNWTKYWDNFAQKRFKLRDSIKVQSIKLKSN